MDARHNERELYRELKLSVGDSMFKTEPQFHSTSAAASPAQQPTTSKPIEIQPPGDRRDSEMNLDEKCIEQLDLGGRKGSKRRKRNKKKIQSAHSICSSLPNIRASKDAVDARMHFSKPSVTDANPFRKSLRRQSAVEPPREPPFELQSPVAEVFSEEYNMRHPRRGVALILNHVNFETEETRHGSDKDCERLTRVLTNLGFEVRVRTDLTFDKVLSVLRALSQENHSLSDCLMVVVLTHGAKGELFAYDHTYESDRLWMNFTADRCPSLAGKPKIFIVQACRGQKFDPGTMMKIQMQKEGRMGGGDAVDASGGSVRYVIPNHADIIVANATVEGFYAWRNPSTGSWFIQTLCDQLELNSESRDLQTILTFVSCRVALHFESDVPKNPLDKMKQIPCVLSMLTRLVYLRRKNPRNN